MSQVFEHIIKQTTPLQVEKQRGEHFLYLED